ncbi:DUF3861 domain-containing protein [Thalassolituus sp.]|jgi:hypothetical protein|uniref:DUF3861 domain-containing protein n=1 Tax=Thalassolituus sp. TaxID=2030822 RepID=UPI0026254698|nr:DUF3861 domain-containing protein [uncultured Thalassolituus sp.]TNC91854.1 MAG: hypothetical protein CSH36_07525 [Thalassolituus sp.]
MKQHQYRIQLEHLCDADGHPSCHQKKLDFKVGNHDDIFQIIERMKHRDDLSPVHATSLALGLKLFSEVMLENKGHPLFTEFTPHFLAFMKKLKGKS